MASCGLRVPAGAQCRHASHVCSRRYALTVSASSCLGRSSYLATSPSTSPSLSKTGSRVATKTRLQPAAASSASAGSAQPAEVQSNFWPCVFTLIKVVVGAGMMAIPRAYYMMGSLLGTAALVGVAILTYWTKVVMVQGAEATGETSYSGLARRTAGPLAEGALQVGLFGFCFGVMAVYLVVIGDILAGAPGQANGLFSEMLGITSGPLLQRSNVILGVSALVCGPLVSVRSMDKLAIFNIIGVVASALLAATAALLGVVAVARGAVQPIPLLPQWELFGDTPVKVVMGLAGVIPVVLNCYVGHQNMFPLMQMLTPYSPQIMDRVAAAALAGCLGIFLVLAGGTVAAFGSGVDFNVLNNLSKGAMTDLLGGAVATVLSIVVRGGFLISLLGSFALLMYPMRVCLIDVFWGKKGKEPGAAIKIENNNFALLTYGTLVSATATAVLVPNIWAALSVVGDLASTVQAFIVPALIGLALATQDQWKQLAAKKGQQGAGGPLQVLVGTVVLVTGVALFANGVIQRLI